MAFEVFQERPNTIRLINENLQNCIDLIHKASNFSYCPYPAFLILVNLSCFGQNKKFKDILEVMDRKIGEFGLHKINEYIKNINEVLYNYSRIDLRSSEKLIVLAEYLYRLAEEFNTRLNNSEISESIKRNKKWSVLNISQRILLNVDLFETRSLVIRKLILTFQRFFVSIELFEYEFDDLYYRLKNIKNLGSQIKEMLEIDNMKISDSESIHKGPSRDNKNFDRLNSIANEKKFEIEDLLNKLNKNNKSQEGDDLMDFNSARFTRAYIDSMGALFKKFEIILIFLLMQYKDKEDFIYPIAGHIDECSRIIEKYCSLNIIFKITFGNNYLNKLRIVVIRILDMFEASKFKLENNSEINKIFKEKYSQLLNLMYKSLSFQDDYDDTRQNDNDSQESIVVAF